MRRLRRPNKRQREKTRRQRISESLKAYYKTGQTKSERDREAAKEFPALPRGFKRLDPRPAIATMLERAGEEINASHGLDYDIRHAVNADESVAYELRLSMPRKPDIQALMTDVVNALRSIPGTWFTIGYRFRPAKMSAELAERYDRYRGQVQVQAYTQHSRPGFGKLEATAEEIYDNVMAKRKGWIAETTFVRVFWTPDGAQPKRMTNLKR